MGQPEDTRSARNATTKRSEGFLELAKIGSGTFSLANPFLAHRKRWFSSFVKTARFGPIA